MDLKKNIGLWPAVSIVMGSVIGSGIFMKPATMAGQLGSPVLLIAVWIVGGVISIFGAMIYAELGSMFPETGGPYVYLQKIYGDFTAFLYGWSTMAVINTAALASIAFVCADYGGYFIHLPHFSPAVETSVKWHIPYIADIYPLQNFGVKTLAILIIVLLTGLNYLSTRSGNALQFIATIVKTLALALLIGGILFSGKGSVKNFITNSPEFHLKGWPLLAAFIAATTGAFSSYDGWYNVNMVAGEIKDPRRNLTRSLLIGLS
ncbi:MAG TPA: amino acid permease, partial [Puia sp.]|nr:amino acid permease [Puia sp.]